MELYTVFNEKDRIFFPLQQFDKYLKIGDLITIDGRTYFITVDKGFPIDLVPMVIVWPVKLFFPFDFMEGSILFNWFLSHLKDLVIEASDERGKVILGKVSEIYTDKIFKILSGFSSDDSNSPIFVDCICKLKLITYNENLTPADIIDIELKDYKVIEIKSDR